MMTGRAGWATLRIVFHPKDDDARADALERLAAEYGAGFAGGVADLIEHDKMVRDREVEVMRIARNARRKNRAAPSHT
jgi:hypothetical protein